LVNFERSIVDFHDNWTIYARYTAEQHRLEVAVLLAVLLICPVGVAALFAFAYFADRNFKDSRAMSGRLPAVAPKASNPWRTKRSSGGFSRSH